jgi:DNA-binding response OmpR family regulator
MRDTKEFYKVLVVEDNPGTAELTKYILEDAGHSVYVAGNAAETLNLLDNNCPESKACYDYTCKSGKCFDAAIIDYDLPDVKGGTLAGWVRSKYPDMALIIFTGYGRLPNIVKAANESGAELLTKPIDPEELLLSVEKKIKCQKATLQADKGVSVSTNSIRHILSIASLSRRANP